MWCGMATGEWERVEGMGCGENEMIKLKSKIKLNVKF